MHYIRRPEGVEQNMNRRSFIKAMGAAGTVAGVPRAASGMDRKPRQMVIILGESVRYDMLNCNRQTGLKTPHLDRLAAQGVNFDTAYNCQPVCAPARSAIWTGLYPHTNGVWGNSMPLGDTTHTIGQFVHDHGVKAAFIGKWHLDGVDYFDTGRPAAGWDPDYWYAMRDYLQELSPEDRVRSRNPATGDDPSWTAELCYAFRCTNKAIDFLAKHRQEDFLLVVSYDEPHGPSLCPIEYSRAYKDYEFPRDNDLDDNLEDKPAEQRVWAADRLGKHLPAQKAPHFFGSHTFVDAEIGRVMAAVEKNSPEALMMYTSDHGVFLDAHCLIDKGPAMYDEITHVPFIVKWPGQIEPGTRSSSLISHIDISGTVMDFFDLDVPKTMEGKSMLPLWKEPKSSGRDYAFIEWGRYEVDHDGFGAFQPIRCICDGRYKLSIHLMTTDELYDLKTDPREMNNLIDSSEHTAIRNRMHDKLLDWMNESRDPFRGYYWGRRQWRPEFPETWANAGMTRQRENDGYLPRELDYDTGLPMVHATRPK